MSYYDEDFNTDFSSTQKADSRFRIVDEDGRIVGYTATKESADDIIYDWTAQSDGIHWYSVEEIPIRAERVNETATRIKPTDTTHKRTVGKVKTVYIDNDNQTDGVMHTQTAGKHFTSRFKSGMNKVVTRAKKPSPVKDAFIKFLDKGGDMILGMGSGFKESESESKPKTKAKAKPKTSSKKSGVKKKTGTKKTTTKKVSSSKTRTTVKKKQTVRNKKSDDDIPMWMR
jgi:hypothetical protein